MPSGILTQQIQVYVCVCNEDRQVAGQQAGTPGLPTGVPVHSNKSIPVPGSRAYSRGEHGVPMGCSSSMWQELSYCLRFTDERTGVQRDEVIHPQSLQSRLRESSSGLFPLLRCLLEVRCYFLVRLTSADNKRGCCLVNSRFVLSALTCLFPQQSCEVSATIIMPP